MIQLVRFYFSRVFSFFDLRLILSGLFTGVAQLQIGSNIENDLVADSVVSALESAVANPATLQAIEDEIKVCCCRAQARDVYLVTDRYVTST